MKRLLVLVFMLPLFAPFTSGEETEVEMRELHFQLAAAAPVNRLTYPIYNRNTFALEGEERVSAVTRGRPQVYEYFGPSPLVFYRGTEPVATYEIPEGMTRALLFLAPYGEGDRYQVAAVNLSQPLTDGDLVLLNITSHSIAVAPGDSRDPRIVDPGRIHLLRGHELPGALMHEGSARAPEEGEGGTDGALATRLVGVRFAIESEEGWNPMRVDLLAAQPNEMRVVAFFPPPVEGGYYPRRAVFRLPVNLDP